METHTLFSTTGFKESKIFFFIGILSIEYYYCLGKRYFFPFNFSGRKSSFAYFSYPFPYSSSSISLVGAFLNFKGTGRLPYAFTSSTALKYASFALLSFLHPHKYATPCARFIAHSGSPIISTARNTSFATTRAVG